MFASNRRMDELEDELWEQRKLVLSLRDRLDKAQEAMAIIRTATQVMVQNDDPKKRYFKYVHVSEIVSGLCSHLGIVPKTVASEIVFEGVAKSGRAGEKK